LGFQQLSRQLLRQILHSQSRKNFVMPANYSNLSLHATAWFFVGNPDEVGEQTTVRIEPPFRIGRNPDVNLRLQCTSVSGLHAEICEHKDELWLVDLNSTNGTFVNGKRISDRCRLNPNDTIQFGTAVFHVQQDFESSSNNESPNPLDSQSERFKKLFTGGVVPFFQPIVDLGGTVDVSGYEVLGRSRLFGLRTPAQMFAAASRMEMEAELSRVLRNQGIKVADEVLADDRILFVNTHPAEIKCEGLEESLFEIRDNYPNRPLTLEVQETLLNDPERFQQFRTTLQNIDIQLALHHFGAGQIRMADLCEIVPHIVKFDIGLIRGIDRAGEKRQQFVANLVKMIKDLGITPMAECVEQQGEHETLRQIGFELGQGFHYGRPASIAEHNETDFTSSRFQTNRSSAENLPRIGSFLENQIDSTFHDMDEKIANAPRDGNWLLAQPGEFYTIQILSAISEENARKHIASQSHPEDFAIFCKQGKTRLLYIVVYGVFSDHAEAKKASAKFVGATVSPWIRMLSSVQAEIVSNATE